MAYPTNLGEILGLMGYELDIDYEVIDLLDGNGPLITNWDHKDPKPTEENINTFYANYLADDERLVEIKTNAKNIVDFAAERARRKYITVGSGQAIIYIRKENEAREYKEAGYPDDLSKWPFIRAETNATGLTGKDAAKLIIAQANVWVTVGTSIEEKRRLGKLNIDTAVNEEEVNTERNVAVATLSAI